MRRAIRAAVLGLVAGAVFAAAPARWGESAASMAVGRLFGDGLPTLTPAGFTDADLEAALDACAARGGCTLRLPAGTYDGVALVLDGSRGRGPGAFPNGLRIECERGAVLRPPVPQRAAVVSFLNGGPPATITGCTFDGLMAEQPHTGRSGAENAIYANSPALRLTANVVIENVTVRNFMHAAFMLTETQGWTIRGGLVENIGCHQSAPENACPVAARQCDCSTGELPDCNGCWRKAGPPEGRNRITAGWGVFSGAPTNDGLTVTGLTIRNVTKIGLQHTAFSAGAPANRVTFSGNTVDRAMSAGISANAPGVVVTGNTVTHSGFPGNPARSLNIGQGISVGNRLNGGPRTVANNTIRGTQGIPLPIAPGTGPVTIVGNVVEGGCSVYAGGANDGAIGARAGWPEALDLSANTVASPLCQHALVVRQARNAIVSGGYYESGLRGAIRFLRSHVTVSKLTVDGGPMEFGPGTTGSCADVTLVDGAAVSNAGRVVRVRCGEAELRR